MADAAHRSGKQCSKGHYMDPNWETCPYCEGEQRSKERTAAPREVAASGGRKTTVGSVPVAESSRETKAMPQPAAPEYGGHGGQGDTRRIMGVLITYSWKASGDLFEVREGKNFIGSGEISSEAYHRDCDVHVPQDTEMSGEHALILCRHGSYELIDQTSTNGTFLNKTLLKSNLSTDLPNYATIQTGRTMWTFIRITPPATGEVPTVPDSTGAPSTDEPKTRVD